MRKRQRKEYITPELEKIYITADAVLTSEEGGGSGGSSQKDDENEGDMDWFSLS